MGRAQQGMMVVFCALVALSLAMLPGSTGRALGASASVGLELAPSVSFAPAGTTFTVAVNLTMEPQSQAISAYTIVIDVNADQLEPISVANNVATFQVQEEVVTSSRIVLTALAGASPTAALQAPGTIATLTLKARVTSGTMSHISWNSALALSISEGVSAYENVVTSTEDSQICLGDAASACTANQRPAAVAGPDQIVIDTDNSGSAAVSLDGSESTDSDGSIAQYQWIEHGDVVATGIAPVVEMELGNHYLTLRVTDNHGATASDLLTVAVYPDGDDDRTLTSDQPVTGTIASPEDADVYTFSGFAGQLVRLEARADGATPVAAHIQLYDSENVLIAESTANASSPALIANILLSFSDTYRLVVNGTNGATGGYQLTLQISVPEASCAVIPVDAYCVEYFQNRDLSGGALTAVEEPAPINHAWGMEGPGHGIGVDQFSGRWRGYFSFDGGVYRFSITTDDGIRIWIDDQLIHDDWQDHGTDYVFDAPIAAGQHLVTVEYYENGGAASLRVVWERDTPPTAEAGPSQIVTDTDGNGTESVHLDGSDSFDPDGIVLSFVWSIEGRNIANGPTPDVVLPVGTHTILLTVGDDEGNSGTDTVEITVQPRPNAAPIADAGPDQTVTAPNGAGADITLDGSNSSDDGTIVSFVWTIGSIDLPGAVLVQTLLPGVHNATLTVTDDQGLTDEDTVTITVLDPVPIDPTVTIHRARTTVNNWINFTVSGYPANAPVSIRWTRVTGSVININESQGISVQTDASGYAAGRFRVPYTPGGPNQRITFTSGTTTKDVFFEVAPRIKITPDPSARGEEVKVSLAGYSAREVVRIRWRQDTRWIEVGRVTTSSTGTAFFWLDVPDWAPDGDQAIRGDGTIFRQQSNAMTVSGGFFSPSSVATEPAPSPTVAPSETVTPSPEPTATAETTPEASPEPTAEPEPTLGPEPTMSPTQQPTPDSTEPAPGPTIEPTEPLPSPTAESTLAADPSSPGSEQETEPVTDTSGEISEDS